MSFPARHLGEIANVNWGNTSITKESYVDTGHPAFSASGSDGFLPAYEFDEQGIVLSAIGARCGRCFRANGKWTAIKNTITIVQRAPNLIDIDYLFYFLNDPTVWPQKGGGQPFISLTDARNVNVPLLPLATQQHIARVLEQADQLRKQAQQMERELNQLAQSLFLEMFGSLGKPINGSKRVRFGDIYRIDSKLVDPRLEKYRSLPHIGPEHIEKETGKILPHNSAEEDALISGKFLFTENEVIYSKIRPYLMKAAMPNFVGLCSADMYPLSPIDGVSTREFLWGALMSDDFKNYLECLPGRANIPKLNRQELAAFEFYVPPFHLQQKYTFRMKAISKQKDGALNKAKTVDELFDALMQRAFNGELTERKAA